MRRVGLAVFLLMAACGAADDDTWPDVGAETACDATPADTFLGPQTPSLGPLARVVPSEGLPAELALQDANNNLDVLRHEGRWVLAFRTAPSHFASPEARLHVLSSEDGEAWVAEATFWQDTDLREPRLLSWDGRLLLLFAVLGRSVTDFEPQGMMASERRTDGSWTEPEWRYLPGFIPWRARVVDGRPELIGYVGGEEIYDVGEAAIEVHWLTTADGATWTPVVPDGPAVLVGGASEADIARLPDGARVLVARVEAYDGQGWGSRVCRAEPGERAFTCVTDPRKYDSPVLFVHGGQPYLIGRRNLTETGHYDLHRDDLTPEDQWLEYELAYWGTPKRCALWSVDPDTLEVSWILDLPSRGDTCFPSVVEAGPGAFVVYNYSSDVEGPDLSWVKGQTRPTFIYRQTLYFTFLL
jgi:hypothetical protein